MCSPDEGGALAQRGLPISADSALTSDGVMCYYKVLPCTRKTKHDWSCCFYSHPGEKARRRSPLVHKYSSVLCLDMMREGHCRYGDSCKLAHSVFEYWLHPDKYKTKMCKDGDSCDRVLCFFAHGLEELRTPSSLPSKQVTSVLQPLAPALSGSSSSNSSCTSSTVGQRLHQAISSNSYNSPDMVFSTSSFQQAVARLPSSTTETGSCYSAGQGSSSNSVIVVQMPQQPAVLQYQPVNNLQQQMQLQPAGSGHVSTSYAYAALPVVQPQPAGYDMLQQQQQQQQQQVPGIIDTATQVVTAACQGTMMPAAAVVPTGSCTSVGLAPASGLLQLQQQQGYVAATAPSTFASGAAATSCVFIAPSTTLAPTAATPADQSLGPGQHTTPVVTVFANDVGQHRVSHAQAVPTHIVCNGQALGGGVGNGSSSLAVQQQQVAGCVTAVPTMPTTSSVFIPAAQQQQQQQLYAPVYVTGQSVLTQQQQQQPWVAGELAAIGTARSSEPTLLGFETLSQPLQWLRLSD